AIDAISCFALHPGRFCISAPGARPNPRWLPLLIRRGCETSAASIPTRPGRTWPTVCLLSTPGSSVFAPPTMTGMTSSSPSPEPQLPSHLPNSYKPGGVNLSERYRGPLLGCCGPVRVILIECESWADAVGEMSI